MGEGEKRKNIHYETSGNSFRALSEPDSYIQNVLLPQEGITTNKLLFQSLVNDMKSPALTPLLYEKSKNAYSFLRV